MGSRKTFPQLEHTFEPLQSGFHNEVRSACIAKFWIESEEVAKYYKRGWPDKFVNTENPFKELKIYILIKKKNIYAYVYVKRFAVPSICFVCKKCK